MQRDGETIATGENVSSYVVPLQWHFIWLTFGFTLQYRGMYFDFEPSCDRLRVIWLSWNFGMALNNYLAIRKTQCGDDLIHLVITFWGQENNIHMGKSNVVIFFGDICATILLHEITSHIGWFSYILHTAICQDEILNVYPKVESIKCSFVYYTLQHAFIDQYSSPPNMVTRWWNAQAIKLFSVAFCRSVHENCGRRVSVCERVFSKRLLRLRRRGSIV